ncbi:MAG: sulfatase-like hydrolase/transferase, partial [Bryobacteraceae bacterium]
MTETPVIPHPSAQSRRQFLSTLPLPAVAATRRTAKPNILVILTDQQSASMLSCAENPWLKTPHMDSLARSGVRFERAYAANPVCSPSRVSLMTGRMPSAMGMECNEDGFKPMPAEMLQCAMGHTFRGAGYRTFYGGKVHLPNPKPSKDILAACGFERLSSDEREELAKSCASFLREKRERPFLLVASLINPHDICYMAIQAFANAKSGNKAPELAGMAGLNAQDPRRVPLRYLADALLMPEGLSADEFFRRDCPPLPAQLPVPQDELSAIIADKREVQKWVRQSWTD